MNTNRTTPLTPLFSSLAILSFKKKSKGSDLGGLSTSMDDLNLDGENLSLSDLGGSVGSLSKLEKKDKKDGGGIDEDILSSLTSGGSKVDDKKVQEIEASVNDLKKHAESADLNSKATKGEIESMKKDLSQINDSIKSLLNVYEAVSRQYNPFVDSELPTANKVEAAAKEEDEGLSLGGNLSLGSLDGLKDSKKIDLLSTSPVDDEGPLDRIVKPDDVEEEEFSSLGKLDLKLGSDILGKSVTTEPEPVPVPAPEPEILTKPRASRPSSSSFDPYALEQIHKLVEYQLSKVYRARLKGDELDEEEVDALDRWMSEFKRLGGG